MAKTGRPKASEPANKKVTVRFKETDYNNLLEYSRNHDMSITQAIHMAVKKVIFPDKK